LRKIEEKPKGGNLGGNKRHTKGS